MIKKKKSKKIKYIILSIIIALSILSVYLITSVQSPFIQQRGKYLYLRNQRFRFVGGNVFNLLLKYLRDDFGSGKEVLESSSEHDIKVIRFWATCSNGWWSGQCLYFGPINWYHTKDTFFAKFDELVEDAKEHDIYLIPVLCDGYATFSYVNEDTEVCKLGSKENVMYKDFVKEVVTRYKNEEIILAWEIGNEGHHHCSNMEDLLNWYEDTANLIKSLDPNHLISSGENNFGTMDKTNFKLVHSIENISLTSVHIYKEDLFNFERNVADEEKINHFVSYWTDISHNELGKPIYFGEFGAEVNISPEFYNDFLESSYTFDVDGVALWSWMEGADCEEPASSGGHCISPERTPSIVNSIDFWTNKF